MTLHPMIHRIARVLGENSELAFEFYCMASEIVEDFEDWGPMIRANEAGGYDARTTISRLRVARDKIIELEQLAELRS